MGFAPVRVFLVLGCAAALAVGAENGECQVGELANVDGGCTATGTEGEDASFLQHVQGSTRTASMAQTIAQDDIACVKLGPETGSGKTELHTLVALSSYTKFGLHLPTALVSATLEEFTFLVSSGSDLYAIKRGASGSGKTEVHVMSAASDYKSFSLHTSTPLASVPPGTGSFILKDNDDLVFVKQGPETGSGKTELHVLSASSKYQDFVLHTKTGLHTTPGYTWEFQMKPNGDLVCIKRAGGSGTTEVHILSASSKYQDFVLHTGTALQQTLGSEFDFCMKRNGDIVAIQRTNTGNGHTTVHILTASSNYQEFSLVGPTALHPTIPIEEYGKWEFAMPA